MTDYKMIARVEYRGCAFSNKSQHGTKEKGAFIEGVHLWKMHLWRVDCNVLFKLHIFNFVTLLLKK